LVLPGILNKLFEIGGGFLSGSFKRGDGEPIELRAAYDAAMASLDSWIVLTDHDARALFVNESFCQVHGHKFEDLVGSPLSKLLGGDDQRNLSAVGAIESAHLAAVRDGSAGRLSGLRLIEGFSGGAAVERIVDVRIDPLGDESGCILLVIEDVTENWRAQEDVIREKRKLNDMVQAIGAGMCLLDMDKRVIWANHVFIDWFGDPAGRFCHQAFRCFGEPCPDCQVTDGFETNNRVVVNWRAFTAGGTQHHFQNTLTPIRDEHGEIFQYLVLTQDVTARQSKIEQLNLLRRLGQATSGTLELDPLLKMILTCMTAGGALGFNRAFLFLRDRSKNILEAKQAVGPTSREEAFRIWGDLSASPEEEGRLFTDTERFSEGGDSPLFEIIRDLSYSLDGSQKQEVLVRAAREKQAQVVTDAQSDQRVTPEFHQRLGAKGFVVVPLIAMTEVVGVVLADNVYSGREITEEHTEMLELFANQAGLAIENARAYAELRDQMKRLRSAHAQLVHAENLATIGRMAAHVAHEIRNPLTTIGGFANSILKNPQNVDRCSDNAQIICQEVRRLEKILSNIMDFTRPAKPDLKPASLINIVREILNQQSPEMKRQGITLQADIAQDLPDVHVDSEKLKQVILNLLRNASQAISGDGVIHVSLQGQETGLSLTIKDSGQGMTDRLLKKIFSPFFTTKSDGTGLGLALSRKLVEDHGGHLKAQSEPGQGSSFTISLPYQLPQDLFFDPDSNGAMQLLDQAGVRPDTSSS
jgi:signal transduction histidine kinase/PAS domain-containing protein